MVGNIEIRKAYIDLRNHNPAQIIILFILLLCLFFIVIENVLPLMRFFFEDFLNGAVISQGQTVRYNLDTPEPLKETSYYLSWAVDIYKNTPMENRYWFNPLLSMMLESTLLSVLATVVLTTLLPRKIGYMRLKVDREIAKVLEKLTIAQFGYSDIPNMTIVANELLNADDQEIRDLVDDLGISFDNLIILRRGLIWQYSPIWYQILHVNDAIRVYMRYYFTVKYSNHVLGFVYIGAAVLIIIIGLRGLKFIPPNQPSLVIFALGMEFSILVVYAITTMYTKEGEETEVSVKAETKGKSGQLSSDFGNSKEIEKLLRVFIKTKKY